jgi:hypothetical protein
MAIHGTGEKKHVIYAASPARGLISRQDPPEMLQCKINKVAKNSSNRVTIFAYYIYNKWARNENLSG